MNTTTLDVFHRVARREISSRDGADQLVDIEAKDVAPARPAWMPGWLYVAGTAVVMIVLAPFTSQSRS
jgi:hypothetical protein